MAAADKAAADKLAADKTTKVVEDASSAGYSDIQVAELLRRVAAAESALADEQRKNAELLDAEANRKVSASDRPLRGEGGGYMFKVGPADPEKYPGLEQVTERACDESEMIRWYCNTHEWPIGTGKIIDPMAIRIRVECVDPARKEAILLAKRISTIRRKLEAGLALTEAENAILDKYESKVHNY